MKGEGMDEAGAGGGGLTGVLRGTVVVNWRIGAR